MSRVRRWLDEDQGYELIGEWIARLGGAVIAAVFTFFAQQAWGFGGSAAAALAVVAIFFILWVTRD